MEHHLKLGLLQIAYIILLFTRYSGCTKGTKYSLQAYQAQGEQ